MLVNMTPHAIAVSSDQRNLLIRAHHAAQWRRFEGNLVYLYHTWRDGLFQLDVRARSAADAIDRAKFLLGFSPTDPGRWEAEEANSEEILCENDRFKRKRVL